MGTLVVLVILIVIVGCIIKSLHEKKKKGGGCGCGCDGCSGHCDK